MKKGQLKRKLNLKKINIAKLSQEQIGMIGGGNAFASEDQDDDCGGSLTVFTI